MSVITSSSLRFRLKAFGLHLLASACVLTLVLGSLYLGWYRWPGWYLADAATVAMVLAGVDVALGTAMTLVIASPVKPRPELRRDIGIIVALQLAALVYGSASLWNGRPMYYAFSENLLQLVQAYDIEPAERSLARAQNPQLAPHWYNLPRWIWAPLPEDAQERERIMASAVTGGSDVIGMPRYFKPWEQGLAALRAQLKPVDTLRFFSSAEQKRLAQRMRSAGLDPAQSNAIPFTGRGPRLLAVFDPGSVKLLAIFKAQ